MQVKFTAPGPVASAFIQSDARRRYIQGPFGSGKSSVCVMEIVRRAAQQAPGPDGFRRTRWAVVRNTMPQLRDTTLKTWFSWFPNGSIGHWKQTERTYYIEVGDIRAEVMFRALDDADDVRNLLSLELTGAWFNECREIHPDIIQNMDGRITRYPAVKDGGQTWRGMWGDTNPPEEDTYWWAISEGLDARVGEENFGKEIADGNGWEAFHQPSGLSEEAENTKNLPTGYYQDLLVGKTKEWIKVYVMGQYGTSKAGKPVHGDFSVASHTTTGLVWNPRIPIVIAADFGLTPAMVLKQQDVHGRVLTFAEVVTDGMGLERAINEKLKPLINRRFPEARFFVTGDPAGNTASQNDEKTCADMFRKAGFKKVKFAYTNAFAARVGATDHFLSRMGAMGAMYQIDRRECPNLVKALRSGYHYPINQKGVTAESPLKNMSSHVAEANQYGDMLYEKGFSGTGVALGQAPRTGQPVKPGSYASRR